MTEPVRTIPQTTPETEPLRRLHPERVCPAQKNRIGERVRRELG
jgi:hypothetical protein